MQTVKLNNGIEMPLLAFIEAVNFVDEKKRASAFLFPQAFGLLHLLPNVLDPGQHG